MSEVIIVSELETLSNNIFEKQRPAQSTLSNTKYAGYISAGSTLKCISIAFPFFFIRFLIWLIFRSAVLTRSIATIHSVFKTYTEKKTLQKAKGIWVVSDIRWKTAPHQDRTNLIQARVFDLTTEFHMRRYSVHKFNLMNRKFDFYRKIKIYSLLLYGPILYSNLAIPPSFPISNREFILYSTHNSNT